MRAAELQGRRSLDVVFGMVLASGVCVATTLLTLLGSQDRDLRLAAVLATCHLAWWLVFVGLLMLFHKSPRVLIIASIIVEPILFGAGATYLAVRWLRPRHDYPEQVTAGG